MMTSVIGAPYLYSLCSACDQTIRFTLKVLPDGQLEYDEDLVGRGLSLHYRTSCEARPR